MAQWVRVEPRCSRTHCWLTTVATPRRSRTVSAIVRQDAPSRSFRRNDSGTSPAVRAAHQRGALGRPDGRLVRQWAPQSDGPAAQRRPAPVEHRRPYVRQGAAGVVQRDPARVDARVGVLDDVLGARLVAHHEQGQPDQPHMMGGEDLREVHAFPRRRLSAGEQLDFHTPETPGAPVCCLRRYLRFERKYLLSCVK